MNTEMFDKVLDRLDAALDKLSEDKEFDVLDLQDAEGNDVSFIILCSYAINDDYYALCEDNEGVYIVFKTEKGDDGEILYHDIDNNTELLEALTAGTEAVESLV